jgi:hypothetical protein
MKILKSRSSIYNIDSGVNIFMTHPNIDDLEIARRGEDLYNRTIRDRVEIAANLGKIISIDIETGNYEIGEDLLDASSRLQKHHPDANIWAERIGFNAVYAVGGTLIQVDSQ